MANKINDTKTDVTNENSNNSAKPSSTTKSRNSRDTEKRTNKGRHDTKSYNTRNSNQAGDKQSSLWKLFASYPELAASAASIQSWRVPGSQMRALQALNFEAIGKNFTQTILNTGLNDAVMVIYLHPTVGLALNAASSINRQFINLYNILRGNKVSNPPFYASDLQCYYFAVGGVLQLIGYIKCLLGIVNYYTSKNLTLPEYIFKALGTDLLDGVTKYGEYIFKLNIQISRLKSLALTGNIPYLQISASLYSHPMFDDDAGDLGNIIMLAPDSILQWSSLVPTHNDSTKKASGLVQVDVDQHSNTIGTLIDLLSTSISALVESDDVRQISGWITATTGDNSYPVDYEFFSIKDPISSSDMRDIISNLVVIDRRKYTGTHLNLNGMLFANIAQDTTYDGLFFDLSNTVTNNDVDAPFTLPIGAYFNFKSKPNPEQILVASQFKSTFYANYHSSGPTQTANMGIYPALFMGVGIAVAYFDNQTGSSERKLADEMSYDLYTEITVAFQSSPIYFGKVVGSGSTGVWTTLRHEYCFSATSEVLWNLQYAGNMSMFNFNYLESHK